LLQSEPPFPEDGSLPDVTFKTAPILMLPHIEKSQSASEATEKELIALRQK